MSSATGVSDANVLDTSTRTLPSSRNEITPRDELLDLLAQALDRDASDILLEPGETSGKVKARANDTLPVLATVGPERLQQYVNMLAAAASLQLHQIKNHPTGGRVTVVHEKKRIECRVSFLPGVSGVAAAIRTPAEPPRGLADVGYEPEQLAAIKQTLRREPGLIVIASPTGGGKSTSAEALLNEIDALGNLSVFQLGETIEHRSEGRTQVETGKDMTWKSSLDGALNFRPDVLAVGEIRTTEQAKLTVDAAMRGPLVICTLHAASAASAITRLQRMGIEGHQLSAALKLVVAQKLARTFCDRCRYAYRTSFLPPTDSTARPAETALLTPQLMFLAKSPNSDRLAFNLLHEVVEQLWDEHERSGGQAPAEHESILQRVIARLRRRTPNTEPERRRAEELALSLSNCLDPRDAPACRRCSGTGLRGRAVVAEVLTVTPEVGAQLERFANGDRIVKHAVGKDGMITMEEAEKRKVARGLLPAPTGEGEPPA